MLSGSHQSHGQLFLSQRRRITNHLVFIASLSIPLTLSILFFPVPIILQKPPVSRPLPPLPQNTRHHYHHSPLTSAPRFCFTQFPSLCTRLQSPGQSLPSLRRHAITSSSLHRSPRNPSSMHHSPLTSAFVFLTFHRSPQVSNLRVTYFQGQGDNNASFHGILQPNHHYIIFAASFTSHLSSSILFFPTSIVFRKPSISRSVLPKPKETTPLPFTALFRPWFSPSSCKGQECSPE